MKKIGLHDFLIGTYEDDIAKTGVSVIIAKKGAVAGCDIRGGAPGTRETDLLDPTKTVEKVHAVVLSGGSAFGLDSCSGVMKYLEEEGIGFDVGVARVPIVSGAVIFDLGFGDPNVRPSANWGYKASKNASKYLKEGSFGAGSGATVGKLRGFDYVMNSGAGYHEINLGEVIVSAYVVVNASGEVYEGDEIIAGCLSDDKKTIVPADSIMLSADVDVDSEDIKGKNTTIGCIMTNANLSKAQCKKTSQLAQNGLALSIRPIHTTMDGDSIFTLSSGDVEINTDKVYYAAQVAMRQAVVNALREANNETKGK